MAVNRLSDGASYWRKVVIHRFSAFLTSPNLMFSPPNYQGHPVHKNHGSEQKTAVFPVPGLSHNGRNGHAVAVWVSLQFWGAECRGSQHGKGKESGWRQGQKATWTRSRTRPLLTPAAERDISRNGAALRPSTCPVNPSASTADHLRLLLSSMVDT